MGLLDETMRRVWVVLFLVVILSLPGTSRGKRGSIYQVNSWLYRGGRPSQADILKLKGMGIKTILSLERGPFKKDPDRIKRAQEWANEAGIRFEHVPMHAIWPIRTEDIEKALAIMSVPENRPIFVHCDGGYDRVGIVIACYRVRCEGWTAEQAYEEMKQYGHNSYMLWWKWFLFRFAKRLEANSGYNSIWRRDHKIPYLRNAV